MRSWSCPAWRMWQLRATAMVRQAGAGAGGGAGRERAISSEPMEVSEDTAESIDEEMRKGTSRD
eukprot:1159345-Pelagomonas_calceolata.AAC.6